MIYSILLFFHVLISIALTVAILMQSSKGGGLSGVFGGGGGGLGSVFGGRGVATFLSKFTIVLAGLFLLVCLIMGKITHDSGGSRIEQSAVQRARTSRVIPMHSSEAQPAGTDASETETPASNPEGGN
ncbi:preprotein translocase subunit SecG [candidate division KSB1 bacterium]|nr:preprotein translocase subunit SecG [candidate division KSB1 bacterium]